MIAHAVGQIVIWLPKADYAPLLLFVVLGASMLATTATYVAHIRGYFFLGRMLGDRVIERAAIAVIAGSVSLGICTVLSVARTTLWPDVSWAVIDTLITLSMAGFLVGALFVAAGLIWRYRTTGILGLLAIPVLAYPFFVWTPWPMILFLIPSTLLLFRQSASGFQEEDASTPTPRSA